jgi:hypothetical protein
VTGLTADSLASGNYKDVMTSFFQLALNDLTGPEKALSFASNPFAIMAKANPKLVVDTSYVRYRHLRDFNFNFSVLLDSNYQLNGFSCGAKYAIINARDYTVSKKMIAQVLKATKLDSLSSFLADALTDPTIPGDKKIRLLTEIQKWNTDSTFKYSYDSLGADTAFVLLVVDKHNLTEVKDLLRKNPNLSLYQQNKKIYDGIRANWQNKPLWTVAASSTFLPNGASSSNGLTANNIFLSSEFLWVFTPPQNRVNLELDILLSDSITTDKTLSYQNLNRNVMSFEPGINFVIKSKGNGTPFFEFKLSGTYYHTLSKVYPNQSADSSTINGVFRIRIINDTWVPITLKMDQAGHVFATMDLKFNFTTLAAALNKKS